MGIALLLLALLPLAFLPDFGDGDTDKSGDGVDLVPPVIGPVIGPAIGDETLDGGTGLLDDPPVDDPGQDMAPGADLPEDPEDGLDILAPNYEDDPPDAGDQNPDPDNVLAPVNEDDVATPPIGDEGDILLPVDQINSDNDTIWINFNDDAGLGYSEIEDFQSGHDVLHVLIEPNAVFGALDVDILLGENGLDSHVFVEQKLVAILKGAPNATPADVIVEIGVVAA